MGAITGAKDGGRVSRHPALWFFLILTGLLALLFHKSFAPGVVHFSNDNPLGIYAANWVQPPECFTGVWADLNYIGGNAGVWPITLSGLVRWILGPVAYSKFYPPITLFFLGTCTWVFLCSLKISPRISAVGALAVVLSSSYVSNTCWGVGGQVVGIGYQFLALAAIVSSQRGHRWIKLALAGMAVGLAVIESIDNGALFSLFIAALVVYQALVTGEGSVVKRFVAGTAGAGLVALCAFLVAAQVVLALIGTQVQGVVNTGQDERARQQNWDWATLWSFPKREALSMIVPGLFGYRMDTPLNLPESLQKAYQGGSYWGATGRDPQWDRYFAGGKQGPPPQAMMRFSGGGCYLGVGVALIALWAAVQAFRKKDSVFVPGERKILWFWIGVAVVALLLAFGRFAPFYRWFYALPYFSTIRNPVKFVAIFNWAVLVLFAFGLHGLNRRYLEGMAPTASGWTDRVAAWWKQGDRFDKRWIVGCLLAILLSVFGWIVYYSSRSTLEQYLTTVQIDEAMAPMVARFSIMQVGWFVLFLSATVGLLLLIMSGVFSGGRARWAAILLGVVVVGDLARADRPWIVHWNYKEKYEIGSLNPIEDFLRNKPFEHRVAVLHGPPQFQLFDQLYSIEWLQQHFPYYNIQSIDVPQQPRLREDVAAFESALRKPDASYLIPRRWALTNTRYLLGAAGYLNELNQQLDPQLQRFRIVQRFEIIPRPGIVNPTKLDELTVQPSPNGSYALFDFTGALPRAKLYSRWHVTTNDEATLNELGSASFNPSETVLVSSPLPQATNAAVADAGTVEYSSYHPKEIRLRATAAVPAVLLLNDKHDPDWHVRVDGKPAELLRCNYIMRGVHLEPGTHDVAFVFEPRVGPMYLSLGSVLIGFVLLGFVLVREKQTCSSRPGADASSDGKKPSSRVAEHSS